MDASPRDWTDEELYARIVAFVEGREIRKGVIQLVVDDGTGGTRDVELLLTRPQLRAAAWAEYDVFDDTDIDVVPRASDPVAAGLAYLELSLEETLETLRADEQYIVLVEGDFRSSVRAELPPVRGTHDDLDFVPDDDAFWTYSDSDDPDFGKPGTYLPRPEWENTDLGALLRSLDPVLQPQPFVYATAADVPEGLHPVVVVREGEGVTLVLEQSDADSAGLPYAHVAAMITLRVQSSLNAVGLTAAVTETLTRFGISANVVAGYHHDHVFVPIDRGELALDLLVSLSRRSALRRQPRSARVWLVVDDVGRASEFYVDVLGGERLSLYGADWPGSLMRVLLADTELLLSEDHPGDPGDVGGAAGTRARLQLEVDDPEAVLARAVEAGGRLVRPLEEQQQWLRGAVVDPFGHEWEIGRILD